MSVFFSFYLVKSYAAYIYIACYVLCVHFLKKVSERI